MWIVILIVAVIIGALVGFANSNDGERGDGALGGAIAGGMGCAYILFQIFLAGVGIFIIIWLFRTLFG